MTIDTAKLRAETLALIDGTTPGTACTHCYGRSANDRCLNCGAYLPAPTLAADTLRLLDEIERLTDENERMRADRDQGARDYCDLMEHRDRQHVQIAKLEAALRPFVKYVHDDLRRGSATYELVAVDRHGGGLIGAEDLRRARAALAEGGPDDR